MTTSNNDEFRAKLGRPKSGSRGTAAVDLPALGEGVNVRRGDRAQRALPGPRKVTAFHRGAVAVRLGIRTPGRKSRRVTVKVRIVNLKRAGPRSIAMHLRYIERDGVTADGSPAHAYGAELDAVDTQEFGSRCRGDRHQFRFIVSPEDGVEIADLKAFTRELMVHMERDLGTKLEWVAVDHWDTDNPHTHVVLRGKDSGNKDLIIDRDYITQGMRGRAAEVAESWLGLRSEQEIEESLNREIDQERWTRIDRAIQAKLIEGVIDLRRRQGSLDTQVERNHMVGRLQHLQSMGLAEESSTSVWRVNPQAEPVLRAMGERGDIIRTMQRAFSNERRDFDIVGPARPVAPIVGRIAAKGLADELHDRRYLIVDGIDGRAHYLVLPLGPTRWNYGSAQLWKYVPTIDCGRPIKPSRSSRRMASIALPGTCKWLTATQSRPLPRRRGRGARAATGGIAARRHRRADRSGHVAGTGRLATTRSRV